MPPRPHLRSSSKKRPAGPKARAPAQPHRKLPAAAPRAGGIAWLYTCRAGFEADLVDELVLAKPTLEPKVIQPALVSTAQPPARPEGRLALAFARQAFPVSSVVDPGAEADEGAMADRTAEALADALTAKGRGKAWLLQAWVPDADGTNPLSPWAGELAEAVIARLRERHPSLAALQHDISAVQQEDGYLAQLCLAAPRRAYVGLLQTTEAVSTAPGGRARMRVGSTAPSRAARKLEEALDWLGVGPEPGDVCVDLGAAPGGWTWVASERRALVICVDPGKLDPEVGRRKTVTHVRGSAFDFEPTESVDWLFCDMVWRPLEVAGLLARWGKRNLARIMVANIKLPMHKKAEFIARIRTILVDGNWRDVRFRQLYHDREEVTVTAWLRP